MPANFLIVCGGAGRGILSRFNELGFDGALQIDVQSELVQVRDGRVQTFGLPVSRAIETPLTTHACLTDYQMRLDDAWQTVHQTQGHDGAYAQCQEEECATYRRQIQHAGIVRESIVDQEFAAGVQQTPLVARAYMTRPLVTRALGEQLQKMLSMRSHATEIVVWIVASTCGGTGNGMVHHVADVVWQVTHPVGIVIKFVRIGGWSYQSLDHLAAVSTFWSVLTDLPFHYAYVDALQPEPFGSTPHCYIPFEYYYIEISDTSINKTQRENFVQSAFAVLCEQVLQIEFAIRFIRRGQSAFVRIGECERGFNLDDVYKLTLEQLNQKLDELLQPRESAVIAKVTNFTMTDPIELVSQESAQLYTTIAKSTTMQPILTGLTRVSNEFNTLTR